MTSSYAVIGDPISHSKSPAIHSLFARQTGEDIVYSAIEVKEDRFDNFVHQFFADGGGGLNVTLPHKAAAYRLAGFRTGRATLAQAVNTLALVDDGRLMGDNTDGIGLVRDLESNNGIRLQGKRLLFLGAGGAVRGALSGLLHSGVESVTVANRTIDRARTLESEFGDAFDIRGTGYAELETGGFDIIINGTSAGVTGEVPPIPGSVISDDCCCYDMFYSTGNTAFVSWALANGAAKALDGLGMLVEQAAESFYLWRKIRPQTAPVIKSLRKNLQAAD